MCVTLQIRIARRPRKCRGTARPAQSDTLLSSLLYFREEHIMSTSRKVTEGCMPFKGYRTYYRIVGEQTDPVKAPLVLLHGGPGSTHNYFEMLDPVADTGRQVISYDQLGCGNSYVEGHPELWTADTWLDELESLRQYLDLRELHLLGQSWGA